MSVSDNVDQNSAVWHEYPQWMRDSGLVLPSARGFFQWSATLAGDASGGLWSHNLQLTQEFIIQRAARILHWDVVAPGGVAAPNMEFSITYTAGSLAHQWHQLMAAGAAIAGLSTSHLSRDLGPVQGLVTYPGPGLGSIVTWAASSLNPGAGVTFAHRLALEIHENVSQGR